MSRSEARPGLAVLSKDLASSQATASRLVRMLRAGTEIFVIPYISKQV